MIKANSFKDEHYFKLKSMIPSLLFLENYQALINQY